jgi:ABC-2 type transport system ATP-binding protein
VTTIDPTAVEARSLTKRYAGRAVVNDLSFLVRRGDVFALLGPNGAGKSTTVEILEGYRHADSGTVSVLGFDPLRDAAALRPRIGVMLQEGGLYPAITPLEALTLFATYYPHPLDPAELIARVGLQDAQTTRYRRLSGGQKQRLSLALALLGRPDVVFLDEPTAGLDPQARRATWDVIAGLRDAGTTVLLTTHYLEEAEKLADRVAIIRDGRLIAEGTPRELMRAQTGAVRLRTADNVPASLLSGLRCARAIRIEDATTTVIETDDAPSLLVEFSTACRDAGIGIVDIRVGYGSLEDVFLALTSEPA